MNSLTEVLKVEQSVQKMLTALKAELRKDVANSPLDCVTPIQGGVKACTVKFSDIAKNSFNLSPSYYIPESQAELVERKLAAVISATDFVNNIKTMIETKQVKINGRSEQLNGKTLEVLQKYIANL